MGELHLEPFQFAFNGFLKVAFQGWNGPAPTPDAHAAIETVAAACRATKKSCAMVTSNEGETTKYLQAGFKIIFGTYLQNSSS